MDMFWGTGSSSYQYEGAASEGGHGPSIWDTSSHTPGRIADNNTGDVAADFYHQYAADIQLMQASGVKHFRFSIAWSRIFPNDTGMVNEEGLDFYRNLTDALLAADITPYVMLYHWDLPQSLQDAASRRLDFTLGLYAPWDYPQSGCLLCPPLTPQEKALLKGSADYLALNHYTTYYVKANPIVINSSGCVDSTAGQYPEQQCSSTYISTDGVPIGEAADSSWLYVVPWGFRELLKYVDQPCGHPEVIVTENGVDVPGEASLAFPDVLRDTFRIDYMQTYLDQAKEAEQAGVKLLGYFYWSLLDNFEWAKGFTNTFGMVHVDFASDARTRTPKDSLAWLANYFA